MATLGITRGLGIVVVAVVAGLGVLATNKYLHSRPQGVPPVVRVANPAHPTAGFGSRPADFGDPRKSTLRFVSKYEAQQGVRANTTLRAPR